MLHIHSTVIQLRRLEVALKAGLTLWSWEDTSLYSLMHKGSGI